MAPRLPESVGRLLLLAIALPAALAWLLTAGSGSAHGEILGFETVGDGMGRIHGVDVVFSGPVDASAATPADFLLTGCECIALQVADNDTQDARLRLAFVPEGTTASRPVVAYAGGTVVQADGTPVPATGPLLSVDKAPPVLRSMVATGLGWSNATVTFSEGVYWVDNGDDALGRELFTYTDVRPGGTTGISSSARQASPGKDVWWVALAGTGTTAQDEGNDTVSPVRSQSGEVEIVDAAGNPARAAPVELQLDRQAPAQITDLRSRRVQEGIELTWTSPDVPDLAGFDVRWSSLRLEGESSFANGTRTTSPLPAPRPGTLQTATIVDLPAEAQVHIAIRAVDRNGNAAPVSNVVSNTTQLDTTPPTRITDLAIGSNTVTETSVGLTWTAPEDPGSGVASYRVYRSEVDLSEASKGAAVRSAGPAPGVPGQRQSIAMTGVPVGKTYQFAVAAVDTAGNEAALGNVVRFVAKADSTPPTGRVVVSSPSHPAGTSSNASALSVTWTMATEAETPGSLVHSYTITRNGTGARDGDLAGAGTGSASVVLRHNGHWCIVVRATSQGGATASEPYCFYFRGGQLPAVGAPTADATTIVVASPGNARIGVEELEFRHRSNRSIPWEETPVLARVAAPPAGQNVTVAPEGLVGTQQVSVRAVNGSSAGPWAEPVEVRFTADDTPPSGVLALALPDHVVPGRVPLSWSAATDGESRVRYDVFIDGDMGLTTEDTSALLDLAAGEYEVRVQARSDGGTGPEETIVVRVVQQAGAAQPPGDEARPAGPALADPVPSAGPARWRFLAGGGALLAIGGGAWAYKRNPLKRPAAEPEPALEAAEPMHDPEASWEDVWDDAGVPALPDMELECHACGAVFAADDAAGGHIPCPGCGVSCLTA